MTIQLHVGLQSMQTVPNETWVAGSQHGSSVNFAELNELESLSFQYISLRDLMVVSPVKDGSQKGKAVEWCDPSQVMFKHELLKLAARAYLQPTGKSTPPKVHLVEKIWKSFVTKNKAIVASAKEHVRRWADACVKFLKTQAFGVVRRIKPQYLGFQRVAPQFEEN